MAYILMKPDKVLVIALGGQQINALVLIILSGLVPYRELLSPG